MALQTLVQNLGLPLLPYLPCPSCHHATLRHLFALRCILRRSTISSAGLNANVLGPILVLALSLFPMFYMKHYLLSMMAGVKNSNDVNPDTVQLHKITSAWFKTGTRTASAQLVLPPCDAQALTVLLSGSKAPDLHCCLPCSATHYRAHLTSEHNLPHGFTRRGDIADVRAGADIK